MAGGDIEQRHAGTASAAVDPAAVGAVPDAVARPVIEGDRRRAVRRELGKRTGEFQAEGERQLGRRIVEERLIEAELERIGRGVEADAAAVRPRPGPLPRGPGGDRLDRRAAQPDTLDRREDQLGLVGRPCPGPGGERLPGPRQVGGGPEQAARRLRRLGPNAEQSGEGPQMRVADEADPIDLLVDHPGQQVEQGDAGIVQIVVGPIRRVARDQRPALLDESVERDIIKRRHGDHRAPRGG